MVVKLEKSPLLMVKFPPGVTAGHIGPSRAAKVGLHGAARCGVVKVDLMADTVNRSAPLAREAAKAL
jgi:hypothetical protein